MVGFRFKQFEIQQDRCAMKVGTDGVLLGAWAEGGNRVLDIGAGTGVISLMMAQRFPDAQVVGIDIDDVACGQARENVANSPFAHRVEITCCPLQDFSSPSLFDAVVSNPPFFVDSLKCPDGKRTMARHADTLPFRELWQGLRRLLSENGVFSVVLPVEVSEQFAAEGYMLGFKLVRRCAVKTVERKQPKRHLLAFSRHRKGTGMEDAVCTMMDGEGNRSEWYRKMTDEFYL